MNNRYFVSFFILFITGVFILNSCSRTEENNSGQRNFNSEYTNDNLNQIAFPIGGIGAGMICQEGTGAISHVSVRNHPDLYNEPLIYAALCVKGNKENTAKILEGQVPGWKKFAGKPESGQGLFSTSYGLPRFKSNTFLARFPFAKIKLEDDNIPFSVSVTGWSPFIPGDEDNSSLPVGALEYSFVNTSNQKQEAVFSFTSENFMETKEKGASIKKFPNGFLLWQNGTEEKPQDEGGFAFFIDDEDVKVNYCLFRGGWYDTKTIAWNTIKSGQCVENSPVERNAPGASMSVPFTLEPGQSKTIRLKFCWYVPNTDLRVGAELDGDNSKNEQKTYRPWYAARFTNIADLANYWKTNYNDLQSKTELFSKTFYSSTLPDEVIEAVGANLSILKSPTVLRQTDGRLWAWEGSGDYEGLGAGTCTHVWNYAQAIPHLFPQLERTLRITEFNENQTEDGFQKFRASLPIREAGTGNHAAVDGQLGGIMKVYREWRISADTGWLKELWPQVQQSMSYCINVWDPEHKGVIEEPHHNTYDIEFWGPDAMSQNFYLGALTAMIKMGEELHEEVTFYSELLKKGKEFLEAKLYNGEYFIQKVKWEGFRAGTPIELAKGRWNIEYEYPESLDLYEKEGPKYQYGNGCLSDGVLGLWLAKACGIDDNVVAPEKVKSHLKAVYENNFHRNLINHENPERPGYAMGSEGGLLLCTWPNGGKPSLPFVYADEVWTGIEYQVASHIILEGMVEEGLEIVRTCRKRYDGTVRNPFDEYEYGHWYARAMASYGLLQALTGLRYDAIDKTLYIDSKMGDDFQCFISTATGFGIAGLKEGKPFIDVKMGEIKVENCQIAGKKVELDVSIGRFSYL